jgi:hypothetical protein
LLHEWNPRPAQRQVKVQTKRPHNHALVELDFGG